AADIEIEGNDREVRGRQADAKAAPAGLARPALESQRDGGRRWWRGAGRVSGGHRARRRNAAAVRIVEGHAQVAVRSTAEDEGRLVQLLLREIEKGSFRGPHRPMR